MKVVNLCVGVFFVGGFLPHQQLHSITLKTTCATLGVVFEEKFSTPANTPHIQGNGEEWRRSEAGEG